MTVMQAIDLIRENVENDDEEVGILLFVDFDLKTHADDLGVVLTDDEKAECFFRIETQDNGDQWKLNRMYVQDVIDARGK